jgi:hypothetical protein
MTTSPDTPLYNHPLPEIEQWLISMGCQQDESELHCWHISHADWRAQVCLEIEELTVRYLQSDSDIFRTFKYSLSRQDVEDAVFAGP